MKPGDRAAVQGLEQVIKLDELTSHPYLESDRAELAQVREELLKASE